MKPWLNLTLFSFFEVIQGRVYRILLAATLLSPLIAMMLSTLFLFDLGKVYIDAVVGYTHILAIIYVIFISVSMLANDIDQKVCYLLLASPATRTSYILGRFFGLILGLLVLLVALIAISALVGEWYMSSLLEMYRSDFSWMSIVGIVTLHYFQYIAILGAIFFIFSWATGAAEIMLFSSSVMLFSWMFPPILLVMQRADVASNVPESIHKLLEFVYQLLPHLNGGTIALTLAHGQHLGWTDVSIYLIEHMSYAGVMLFLAIWKFSKRDL